MTKKAIIPAIIAVFMLAALLSACATPTDTTANVNSTSRINASSAGNTTTASVDAALVGTWESDCLVPDENSPWSEKHQFVINADGTAVHTRWSSGDHDCAPGDTLVNSYTIKTEQNQIDLNDLENDAIIYDIYKIEGTTLRFGHGFRGDHLAYPQNDGTTSTLRIENLNDFIVYHKM
ncbi:MAG: hypothetical protein WCV50_06045 [Patescibacteria group bacterium]|jgi:hypothetical protein